jgi:hypothetical protein
MAGSGSLATGSGAEGSAEAVTGVGSAEGTSTDALKSKPQLRQMESSGSRSMPHLGHWLAMRFSLWGCCDG